MRTIDTKSPDYEKTKRAITAQFADQPPTAKLKDFSYIGHDDEFALPRHTSRATPASCDGW